MTRRVADAHRTLHVLARVGGDEPKVSVPGAPPPSTPPPARDGGAQAEDIFCTNYKGGEGKKVLPYRDVQNFRADPLATMQQQSASIIAALAPVGALSSPDHKLQTNNPISLTGSLPDGVRENACSGDAAGHLGDYATSHARRAQLLYLAEAWRRKYDALPSSSRRTWARQNPCPVCPAGSAGTSWSQALAAQWGLNTLNHPADYQNQGTYETSSFLLNTICFHTCPRPSRERAC